MRPRPRPERVRMRPRPEIFFEAEATMYEAEARHVREQLSVYEDVFYVFYVVYFTAM